MSEWKKCKLGDITIVKGGKRLPKGESLSMFPSKHPYIRTRDITNHKIKIDELLFVPNDVFPSISNYIVEENDIIISIVGTIGLCAIIPKELHMASLTENCAKIVNLEKSQIDNSFLFYYLISENGQSEIKSRIVGSTQPKLPLYNIKDIPIPLPPLPEQKAIAAVLSSLDDKIDLLHRQNKTLEDLAETLFRQWFIEEAQDDWEKGTLGDLINISSGKGLKRKEYIKEGTYPVLGANGLIGRTNKFLYDEKLIFTGRVGTLGNVFISEGKVWLSDNTLVIKPKSEHLFYFIYFYLKIAKLENFNVGSTQPLIRQSDLNEIELKIPFPEILKSFSKITLHLFEKIKKNNSQIHTLENLRDILLPKLMSGEVRVKTRPALSHTPHTKNQLIGDNRK